MNKLNLNCRRSFLTTHVNVGSSAFNEVLPENVHYFTGNWLKPSSLTKETDDVILQGHLNELSPEQIVEFLQDIVKILRGSFTFDFFDIRQIGEKIIRGLEVDKVHSLVRMNSTLDLGLVSNVLSSLNFEIDSIQQKDFGYKVVATYG